ncbi:helix-turn-helix domain-containing protein [Streptomyces rishiriensis]|uniref:AraC family transcriptional activator of tynA and feaB n=1 Tax=Streptomyces rishiriensis TaxID=68264 RepID=A0ABU0NGE4_STRRH|nr:helix-turn-helix domain-containing protein [Streptomyces rishiriensis]MDQ0578182.1 AraC family transcriptional activator of tynA and feaB [Streptomyces rishiriensis]
MSENLAVHRPYVDGAADAGVSRRPNLLASVRIPPRSGPEMQDMVKNWNSKIFTHVTDLALPSQYAWREFRFDAHGYRLQNIIYAKHRSDAVTGISGRGDDGDPIVVHIVLSGWVRFEDAHHSITVEPGYMCVRDTRRKWRFWYGPGAVCQWLVIPRTRMSSSRTPKDPVMVACATPEARLLISYLDMLNDHDPSSLSVSGEAAMEEATISLLCGLISANVAHGIGGRAHVVVEAAKKIVDENLEKADLDPAVIANILDVSVRTLHRSFAAADDSVMSYVRRRRIEEAQMDIINGSAPANISDLAAKWHFSDSSHFIRQFKQIYGTTPAAYLRTLRVSR